MVSTVGRAKRTSFATKKKLPTIATKMIVFKASANVQSGSLLGTMRGGG